ncbi:MAG TPA: tetratricopeptide repeat protein [Planctomycetes bacterium]|nr:tetratricopeptide repeat protein [Planctomycetota bacterium]
MGLLSNFMRGWEKRRLEALMEKNPRPPAEVFVRLAVIYQDTGDITAASRVAKRGQQLYPHNMDISRASKSMDKVVRELEKERLRQKIESYPNPILYARLAELYKTDGQIDASVKVCQAGIRAFPDYGGTYLLLGQMCFEQEDFPGALDYLEKAVELDRYNYMALKLLADTYTRLGRHNDAVERLEAILYFAPGDEQVTQALAVAKRAAGVAEPSPQEASSAAPPAPPTRVKEASAAPPPPAPPTRVKAQEPARVKADTVTREKKMKAAAKKQVAYEGALNILKTIDGVRGALLVDAYGLVIASYLDDSVDEELAGAMITNIYRATARSAQQMGLGTFEDGVIEGEEGNIHIITIQDMILSVFALATIRMGLLEKAIRDFAAVVMEVG